MEQKNFKTMTPQERVELFKNSKNPMLRRMALMMEKRMKMVESAKAKEE